MQRVAPLGQLCTYPALPYFRCGGTSVAQFRFLEQEKNSPWILRLLIHAMLVT